MGEKVSILNAEVAERRQNSLESICGALGANPEIAHQNKLKREIELGLGALRDLDWAHRQVATAELHEIAKEFLSNKFNRAGQINRLLARRDAAERVAKSGADVVMEVLDKLSSPPRFVRLGYDAIDDACGGVLKGTVGLIGAYTGHGKSAFIAGSLTQLVKKHQVGFISLEDPCKDAIERVACSIANVPLISSRSPANEEKMGAALEQLYGLLTPGEGKPGSLACLGPEHFPASGATPEDLEAAVRDLVAKGSDVVLVDHLSELKPDGSQRTDLTYSRGMTLLRSIAIEHDVAIDAACQLKQIQGGTAPSLYSFAGSSELVRRCRLAITIQRSEDAGAFQYVATIQKATRGGSGQKFLMEMRQGGVLGVSSEQSAVVGGVGNRAASKSTVGGWSSRRSQGDAFTARQND